jgi:SSS family solute:Na+ symporter
MGLSGFDVVSFLAFLALVVGVSLYASRKEESAEDYFLAGRGLRWWLIGISLVASNISTEHFVGMAGKGYELGLAIASFEWIAVIALVVVALVLLPRFLRAGIYTLPEYLEYRYDATARAIMAFYLMVMYVVAAMAGVLYTGALTLQSLFGVDLYVGVWAIGLLAGAYTIYGGLKAVVWSDLIQGVALLGGGLLVMLLGFAAVGGPGAFFAANGDKLHMVLPADHPTMPWTILLLGIWIPNLAYWGLNQFITQRALAARDLTQGQRGILFAAALKLLIPFLVVFPGMMAFQLYGDEVGIADQAFPFLMKRLLPAGLHGAMLAALFGAVMSSLDSMLNSASTIFTKDLYERHWARERPSQRRLVAVGRLATGSFVIFACLLAPELRHMGAIYDYMQEAWNFIWPGILAAFLWGIVLPRAPSLAGVVGLLAGVPLYAVFNLGLGTAYLNAAALSFLLTSALMLAITWWRPLPEPRVLPDAAAVPLESAPGARAAGFVLIAVTVALYLVFW